ncbi:hypothetical protein GCM10010277_79160 [Streptomyces longisporoflavus]|nr:hypothetical protein GCM10010277_79160 [Streptomyces longisporoflavus]
MPGFPGTGPIASCAWRGKGQDQKEETRTPRTRLPCVKLDSSRNRVGVMMGKEGGLYQLRPPPGGREWDAKPQHVRHIDLRQLLGARVAAANARSGGRQA